MPRHTRQSARGEFPPLSTMQVYRAGLSGRKHEKAPIKGRVFGISAPFETRCAICRSLPLIASKFPFSKPHFGTNPDAIYLFNIFYLPEECREERITSRVERRKSSIKSGEIAEARGYIAEKCAKSRRNKIKSGKIKNPQREKLASATILYVL